MSHRLIWFVAFTRGFIICLVPFSELMFAAAHRRIINYRLFRNLHSCTVRDDPYLPQGGVLSPTLFNIYTSDVPPQCTGSGHGLCRRHHNHILTHKYKCSQEIHTTILTQSFCLDKTKQPLTKSRQNNLHSVHYQTLQNIRAIWT